MDIGEIMKMAGQWRSQLAKMESEAAEVRATGESGGGMVKVTISGQLVVQAVEIDPSLLGQADNRTLLQDLVRAATNAAVTRAKVACRGKQGELLRGMGLDPSMLDMMGGQKP